MGKSMTNGLEQMAGLERQSGDTVTQTPLGESGIHYTIVTRLRCSVVERGNLEGISIQVCIMRSAQR
jgi:hypothetical protein